MAFGSQCAVSTTEQSSPCQWNFDVRKGMEGCGSGYDAQEGNLTVTKQQGSGPSVAWTKNILAVSHREAQPQGLALFGNQP